MSRISAKSIWALVHGAPSLRHVRILDCLSVLISVHLGHLLMCSSTYLQYPGHLDFNLILLCVTVTPPLISSCTLLIIHFLKIWDGTTAFTLYIFLLSILNLRHDSLKGRSDVVQLLNTFFLVCSSIPLSMGSCMVSLLSVLRDSTSLSQHCMILSSEYSCSSPFSL